MERELALEIVRVTELAALHSARWMGRAQKEEADRAATEAMRKMFNTVSMDGTVVIGEGEMDEAPMLFIGERLGTGVHRLLMSLLIRWRGRRSSQVVGSTRLLL